MIPAYEGNEPYIFVSYAHKDSPRIFRIIEKLSARGYRIWYDEGIEPGSEWPEYIANHLIRAEMVLSFLTPNAVESVNCRREINFALSRSKPVLAIYMENMDIPAGMELQLSSQQNILYYNYDSEERFLDKVETCQHLVPCRTGTAFTGEPAVRYVSNPPAPRTRKPPVVMIAAAGVCLAALVIFLIAGTGKKKEPEADNTIVETTAGDSADSVVQDGSGNTDTTVQNDAGTGQNTENEPVSSAAAAGTWDYTIVRSEESTTYSFDRGPQIVMPASWGSQVTVLDEGDHVSFYHTASMESWKVDGYDNTGYLFRLYLDPTQDYKHLPSFMDLGKTSEGYFYLMFPTDFQAYAGNERIMEQYQTLYEDIDYVKVNSYMAQQ
ncbi:MAG: toll/interleukin-1 receptor domain-containing protein [Eubacteriales bacterium]|nr:toll/interleukin-1 receptor domain-containing protein [Eubacteriales bacterium]